ncbi:MAG TPA: tRNA preQ1(34) S-adenosylmethionine ribosyltransferase-isomerase QueA [Candidatus Paceibacterota bacterium]|nr:tRNA preQ1(34) S-adenosylmethionine ribosyltransferase-isomerase QueA [Candidatus Paceibacterota bacterium]HPT39991.1 tRNA preQ1(34) S-adenosylmethionine ribosyltransferase-isomerase QueA [Candidatus Paceibacterota bacterium]
MKLQDFDYNLPKELIAQKPICPRDYSRLLVLDKLQRQISHHCFCDIGSFLRKNDVLVLNNTKVIPARLIGKKIGTGGKVEVFLIRPKIKDLKKYSWPYEWVAIGGPKLYLGQKIDFGKSLKGEIIEILGQERIIKFNKKGELLKKIIFQIGQTPIPPYIKSPDKGSKLQKEYQTVFAKYLGSVAAPTAGFHFTPRLLKQLQKQGVKIEYVTLHVGLGTFQPVKEGDIEKHKMHSEWAMIDNAVAKRLNQYKKKGQRIISVGTTACRTLESFCDKKGELKSGAKFTDIFIYPGYNFRFVDGLITNFHLPKSTLLMLVSAFANQLSSAKASEGIKLIKKAYQEAIKNKYRFYSFGDAMLIV